VSIGLDPG